MKYIRNIVQVWRELTIILLLMVSLSYFTKYELLCWEIGSTLDNFEAYRSCLVSANNAEVEDSVAILVSAYLYYPDGSRFGYSDMVTPVVRIGRTITAESLIKTIASKTHESPLNGIAGEYDELEYLKYWVEKYGRDCDKNLFKEFMKNETSNYQTVRNYFCKRDTFLSCLRVNENCQYDQQNQLINLCCTENNEHFHYDSTGNWLAYSQNDTLQTRTHNSANEIVTLDGSDTSIRTDAAGNMTRIPNPRFGETSANAAGFFYATRRFAASGSTQPQNLNLTYDAWNRLVRVTSPDGTLVAEYRYDALNRRVTKTTPTEMRRFYYNRNWQCLLETATNQPSIHYTWGLRYIDNLICRHVGLDKIYSLPDPNWNVAALVDSIGIPVERYTYNAFGKLNVYDGNFTPRSSSNYNWTRTFTGQILDADTNLLLYRNRFCSPLLGRFLTRDPIGYNGGDNNLFRYVKNLPVSQIDILGLQQKAPGYGASYDYNPPSRPKKECCNGKEYYPDISCCENNEVVERVSLWHCTRPLNAPYVGVAAYYTTGWIGWWSNCWIPQQARHSYVCCDGVNQNCFGMQQRQPNNAFTKEGDSIPQEKKPTGACYEYKVCPTVKKTACETPTAPYHWYTHNCNVWAASCVEGGICVY